MNVLVQRNGQTFGPYSLALAQRYLAQGQLLAHDLAREESNITAPWITLQTLLTGAGVSSATSQNPLGQSIRDLKTLDLRLLFPWKEISSLQWLRNRRLIYLAAVGLAPATVLAIAPGVTIGYWAIALYFSSLWALFFYYLFRTPQVQPKLCLLCFFFTGIISISLLLVLQQIPPWSLLYHFAGSHHFLPRLAGMFLGVGIHEELCKAAILIWLVRRPGSLLAPQTVVFYGMISGLGFGIYEGVNYQQTVNRAQGVDAAYFLDIVRLTSLPFLHAIWTGIAGYFLGFAALVPKKQYGLFIVAIIIPATLHAIYDTFGWNLIGLGAAFLSVMFLMAYLSNVARMQKHLASP